MQIREPTSGDDAVWGISRLIKPMLASLRPGLPTDGRNRGRELRRRWAIGPEPRPPHAPFQQVLRGLHQAADQPRVQARCQPCADRVKTLDRPRIHPRLPLTAGLRQS
jgi:hypothetical protein